MTVSTLSEEQETARLAALHALGVDTRAGEERYDRIVRLARHLFGVPMAAVNLMDRDLMRVKSVVGGDFAPGDAARREDTMCTVTVAEGVQTVVEDLDADRRFAGNPYVVDDPGIKFYAGRPLFASGGHAVGTLCLFDTAPRRFTAAQRELLDELGGWVEVELNRTDEMERAAEVQQALVPGPLRVAGYEIGGTCLPARSVGGDLVDWYRTGDDVVVTLGDVMGKGIGAALMMATVRSALRTAGRTHPPAAAVREAASALEADLASTSTLVTLCTARVETDTGTVRWTDAGHGLMVLLRADGTVERPPPGGLPIGTVPGDEWPEFSVRLGPGDMIAAFSDGLLDLFPTIDVAIDTVVRGIREDPAGAVARLRRFVPTAGLTDDVAAVLIRRTA